ncbi:MAG: hypothetical protein ACLFXM_02495 [Acidimicrobiia bacterium]
MLGARAIAMALAVVAAAGACGDDDDGIELPEVDAGEMYVPGPVDGHPITAVRRIRVGDPVFDRMHGIGPLTVARVDGAVVGVVTVPSATMEAAWRGIPDALGPDPRVPSIAGHPTVAVLGDGFAAPHPAQAVGWRTGTGTMVAAASRDVDLPGLVAVAERVTVAGDGQLGVPGETIGRIPEVWTEPRPAVRVRYGGDDVIIHTANPGVQAAYRALLHEDPAGVMDPVTDPSCCQPEILTPVRTVEIGDRTGVLGTLTSTTRALVVEGDPGAVLLAQVGLGVTDDATLLAIADSLTAVEEAEVDDNLAELGPPPDGG